MSTDIRWQQRFQNFCRAFEQLNDAVLLANTRPLSPLEQQGLIQVFEYTYELGWKTFKDYLTWQGIADIVGSRDTIREAFKAGLIDEGQAWMDMLVDRNRTSHTYNKDTADAITHNILHTYHPQFTALITRLQSETDAADL